MDTTATLITFDDQNVCNYCTEFLERSSHIIHEDLADKEARLNKLVEMVKASGKGKPYDCIVGVSGGVDSPWTLVEVKRLGLALDRHQQLAGHRIGLNYPYGAFLLALMRQDARVERTRCDYER